MGNLGQDTARLMGHTKITVPISKGMSIINSGGNYH